MSLFEKLRGGTDHAEAGIDTHVANDNVVAVLGGKAHTPIANIENISSVNIGDYSNAEEFYGIAA